MGKNIRQQPHSINLPNPHPQQRKLHQHINRLTTPNLGSVALGLEFQKLRIRSNKPLDGTLEEHEYHHDAEDL